MMKIIQIVPGFGGTFYCGNCLRDSGLIRAMRQEGHDAVTLPMYLPLTLNQEATHEEIPVFYGAVNIYLKQRYPWLRNMPHRLERLFNSKPLLRLAAYKASSTRAEGLEGMTESMLLGQQGNQAAELEELITFLKGEKPHVVHLSNALLLGMAQRIREEMKIPVICSLQDEDVWVDAMAPSFRQRIWDLMTRNGEYVDGFVAVSRYYAELMRDRMKIPAGKLQVVHIGVDPGAYEFDLPVTKSPAIGFLSRMNEANGFGLLVDAFIELKQQSRFDNLRLYATGGMTRDDDPFFRRQMKKLKRANLTGEVEILHRFSQGGLKAFFRKITLLSVPVLRGEAFGLYQLEALASGIPLVQPAVGAFPEIIEATGGGVVYEPNTAESLASALGETLSHPEVVETMSRNGRDAVMQRFNAQVLTRRLVGIYQQMCESTPERDAG